MTVRLALRGLRGESFADVARRQGSIAGTAVSSSATDSQVLAALVAAASLTSSVTNPNVYASTAAGLAAVSEGQLFWVVDGGLLNLYRDDAGSATLLAELATQDAFDAAHPKTLLGDLTTQAIDTNLNGSPIAADIGQIFIGNTVASADAITIDSGANFPGGIAFRRYDGTAGSPTEATTGGLQLGYLDYRALFEGEFHNAGSFDMVIDGAGSTNTGCPPPTKFRWAVSDGEVSYVPMELRLDGRLELGAISQDGETYSGPGDLGSPRLFVNGTINDYTAIIAARPASGSGYALRLHTDGTDNTDLPLYVSAGAGGGSPVAAITGTGRLALGGYQPTAPLDVSGDTIRVRTSKTPASAGATGNAGDICWDSGFVYVCVSANTWKRAALSTW